MLYSRSVLYLFLLTSSNCFYNSLAEEVHHCGDGTEQLRQDIEEYFKEKARDSINTILPNTNEPKLDIDKDIQEIVDKTILQLSIDSKQIINTIKSAYGVTNRRTEEVDEIKKQLTELEDENKQLEQDIKDNDKCIIKVPDDVKPNPEIWRDSREHAIKTDDLDIYMNNKRGCQYEALILFRKVHGFPVHFFNDKPFKLYFALRTPNSASISVFAKPTTDYKFEIGEDNNTVSKLKDHKDSSKLLAHTPGIIAGDKYTEFYIKIENNVLSIGKVCEKPFLTQNVTIKKRERVFVSMKSNSMFGAKVLHDCPNTFPDDA